MLTEPGRTAAFALLVAAATLGAATTAAVAADKKITLVQMHPVIGVGEEIFLYAVPKRLGFFAAEGLDVEVQGAQNGVVAAQVLQSKGAQVGTTAPEAIMLVREQGGDLVSFYGLKRNAGTFLVVLEDLPIRKLEDLKGKNVGAPSFGAGGGLALKTNLAEMGIPPEQYTGIATGAGPAAIAALRSGKIDALVMWDAMLGAAENTGLKLRTVADPVPGSPGRDVSGHFGGLRQGQSRSGCRLLPGDDQGAGVHQDQSRSGGPHLLGGVSEHQAGQSRRGNRAQEQRAHHEAVPREGARGFAGGLADRRFRRSRPGRTRTPRSPRSAT